MGEDVQWKTGLVNGDRRIPLGRRCTMENRVHVKVKW